MSKRKDVLTRKQARDLSIAGGRLFDEEWGTGAKVRKKRAAFQRDLVEVARRLKRQTGTAASVSRSKGAPQEARP